MASKSESAEKDQWVHCPYNHEHHMPQSRLQWHLVKCPEKRTRGHEYTICPYNSIHIIPKSELESHKAKCKDKRLVKNFANDSAPIDNEIKAYLANLAGGTKKAGKESSANWNGSEWHTAPQVPVGYSEKRSGNPETKQKPTASAKPSETRKRSQGQVTANAWNNSLQPSKDKPNTGNSLQAPKNVWGAPPPSVWNPPLAHKANTWEGKEEVAKNMGTREPEQDDWFFELKGIKPAAATTEIEQLTKKLELIDELEYMAAKGEELNNEQQDLIDQKSDIIQQLRLKTEIVE